MNVLLIIIICLLSSSFLQGIGFFIYSEVYKKRFLKSYTPDDFAAANKYSMADQPAPFNDFKEVHAGKNMINQTTNSRKSGALRSNEGSKVINNPLVLVKAQ